MYENSKYILIDKFLQGKYNLNYSRTRKYNFNFSHGPPLLIHSGAVVTVPFKMIDIVSNGESLYKNLSSVNFFCLLHVASFFVSISLVNLFLSASNCGMLLTHFDD